MRSQKNQSTFRQSMLNALGALGQTEMKYTVLPGPACTGGNAAGHAVNPAAIAIREQRTDRDIPYQFIAETFRDQNIELADPDSWYIGGFDDSSYQKCDAVNRGKWEFGFTLARATGTVSVPKWIYRPGMSEAAVAAAAAKSNAESARGLVKTCTSRYPNTTPTQADAFFRTNPPKLSDLPRWEQDCLREWSTATAPASGADARAAAIAAAAAAAAAARNRISDPTEYTSNPTACRAGYKTPPPGGHITCLPGYGIDVDASGCEACVSACSPGWSPPDQAPRECQPGESFQVDPRTRCVRCARGSNCWTTGMAPVPCPAPFVVQQRGAYSCCVAPQQGQQQTSQPQTQTGPVPAPGQDVMPAMSIPGGGLSKGWIIAGAALIAVIAFGGSSSKSKASAPASRDE